MCCGNSLYCVQVGCNKKCCVSWSVCCGNSLLCDISVMYGGCAAVTELLQTTYRVSALNLGIK